MKTEGDNWNTDDLINLNVRNFKVAKFARLAKTCKCKIFEIQKWNKFNKKYLRT